MGDMSGYWHDVNSYGKNKRQLNTKSSTDIIVKNHIKFESHNNGIHLVVGDYDYWPSTGLFINRKNKKKGRGVFKLIAFIKENK